MSEGLTGLFGSMHITNATDFEYNYVKLLDDTLFPQFASGNERPLTKDDFQDYRLQIDEKLSNIKELVQGAICENTQYFNSTFRNLRSAVIMVCGEHHTCTPYNNELSTVITNEICKLLCTLYNCSNISQILNYCEELLADILSILQQKLQKNTWKMYPTAVTCYKWLIYQIREPQMFNHIHAILPTTLIITDDFEEENISMGLDFLKIILTHCSKEKLLFAERGYDVLLYDVLSKLIIKEHKANLQTLLPCMAMILNIMDDSIDNNFEWSRRNAVIQIILSNMEFESNNEARLQYMSNLPEYWTNHGCAVWCSKLVKILSQYFGNHTDVKTLKATLETAKHFLTHYQHRVLNYCKEFYDMFLKLYFDLTEIPVFDKEIVRNLEFCICLMYKMTPEVRNEIMKDSRIRLIINDNLTLTCFGDVRWE